jgi:hypothetical protein
MQYYNITHFNKRVNRLYSANCRLGFNEYACGIYSWGKTVLLDIHNLIFLIAEAELITPFFSGHGKSQR